MLFRNALLATCIFSLAACESRLDRAEDPNRPADSADRQIVDNVALGITACAAYLTNGTPLSSLDSQGFSQNVFGNWKAGAVILPVTVSETRDLGCRTTYPDSINGINGAFRLASQTLKRAGYSEATRTASNGDTIRYYVKSGSEIDVGVRFSSQSGMAITLTN